MSTHHTMKAGSAGSCTRKQPLPGPSVPRSLFLTWEQTHRHRPLPDGRRHLAGPFRPRLAAESRETRTLFAPARS